MAASRMTPGPWHVNFYVYQDDPAAPTGRRAQIVSDSAQVGGIMDGAHIAGVGGGVADVRRHGLMAAADARAIAALPELVEAARQTVQLDHAGMPNYMRKQLAEVRRILARIDGETGGDK